MRRGNKKSNTRLYAVQQGAKNYFMYYSVQMSVLASMLVVFMLSEESSYPAGYLNDHFGEVPGSFDILGLVFNVIIVIIVAYGAYTTYQVSSMYDSILQVNTRRHDELAIADYLAEVDVAYHIHEPRIRNHVFRWKIALSVFAFVLILQWFPFR